MEPTALHSFHIVHAMAVLAAAVLCCIVFRRRLQKSSNHYLLDWLGACVLWSLYYLLKAFDIVGGPAEGQPLDFSTEMRLFSEFAINGTNTIFILGAARSISEHKKDIAGKLINTLLTISGFLVLLIGFRFTSSILGMSLRDWMQVNTVAVSFLAGCVLILLYSRPAALPWVSPAFSGVALWALFGYAFLQAWYPYIIERPSPGLEWLIYISALLLKIICTFIVFLASKK